MLRLLRPFIYLLLVSVLGRQSWRALGVSFLMDLGSDEASWAKYFVRSPVFERVTFKIIERIPGLRLLAGLIQSYQAYISYTL
jgi:hypothetical protein